MGVKKAKTPAPGVERWCDAPEGVRVLIKNPTERQRRRMFQMQIASFTSTVDVETKKSQHEIVIDPVKYDGWKEVAILDCVLKVENYIDGNGKLITTAEELWEHGETEIIDDVSAEVYTGYSLEEEARKNLEGPSDSSKQGAPQSSPVKTVEEKASVASSAPM